MGSDDGNHYTVSKKEFDLFWARISHGYMSVLLVFNMVEDDK